MAVIPLMSAGSIYRARMFGIVQPQSKLDRILSAILLCGYFSALVVWVILITCNWIDFRDENVLRYLAVNTFCVLYGVLISGALEIKMVLALKAKFDAVVTETIDIAQQCRQDSDASSIHSSPALLTFSNIGGGEGGGISSRRAHSSHAFKMSGSSRLFGSLKARREVTGGGVGDIPDVSIISSQYQEEQGEAGENKARIANQAIAESSEFLNSGVVSIAVGLATGVVIETTSEIMMAAVDSEMNKERNAGGGGGRVMAIKWDRSSNSANGNGKQILNNTSPSVNALSAESSAKSIHAEPESSVNNSNPDNIAPSSPHPKSANNSKILPEENHTTGIINGKNPYYSTLSARIVNFLAAPDERDDLHTDSAPSKYVCGATSSYKNFQISTAPGIQSVKDVDDEYGDDDANENGRKDGGGETKNNPNPPLTTLSRPPRTTTTTTTQPTFNKTAQTTAIFRQQQIQRLNRSKQRGTFSFILTSTVIAIAVCCGAVSFSKFGIAVKDAIEKFTTPLSPPFI